MRATRKSFMMTLFGGDRARPGALSHAAMPVVETDRLTLRPPQRADVQAMFEIHQDPDVMRFVGKPGDISVAWRNVAMMIGHWQMLGYGMWVVVNRANQEVLGRAGLWHEEGGPGLELGWLIRKSAWGHGYATEAARASLDWAWQNVAADHIISVIHTANRPSLRIAEKLGQRLERTDVVEGEEMLTYGICRSGDRLIA
jgi:RimJ/RimL family protein N-acetyltransferase